MNKLEKYFYSNETRKIHKGTQLLEIYDKHFSRFIDTDVHIMEIGVKNGGSLQMWKEYFGKKSKIFGVDINPQSKFEEEQIEVFILDQSKVDDLNVIKGKVPRIDILLDDGGHFPNQQITTFKELFSHISENGVYMCEDVHTSYWENFNGGYKKEDSFIEYSKNFIDYINARLANKHRVIKELPVSEFTRSMHSVHFYQGAVVVEKCLTSEMKAIEIGNLGSL